MLEIQLKYVDGMPVAVLQGKLDSYGATLFDEKMSPPSRETRELVLDLSRVSYLSSMGIRSLIKIEKALRKRSGGITLAALPPFLMHILDVSGLLSQFRTARTLDEAIEKAKSRGAAQDTPAEKTTGGRTYLLRAFSGAKSHLDLWGREDPNSDQNGTVMIPTDLKTLGPGFGIGGLGRDLHQAQRAIGVFISAGPLVGVVPADGHCIPDFQVTAKPRETLVYVDSALGFSGDPGCFIEGDKEGEITLSDLTGDLLDLLSGSFDRRPSLIGMILFAETIRLVSSHFIDRRDIFAGKAKTKALPERKGLVMVGVAGNPADPDKGGTPVLFKHARRDILGGGRFFHGHGFQFTSPRKRKPSLNLAEELSALADLEELEGVGHIEPETKIRRARVWIYLPATVRSGAEKLLRIDKDPDEDFPEAWDIITRRVFSEESRVILRPIHGGFMSKTFYVTSYGRDGRRRLPAVLKIAPTEITRREEEAYHRYVEPYILNNATTIMGTSSHDNWAGIRYNFVGIGGPESHLTWLTHHFREKPAEELVPLFETIFTTILKPWHGQPTWEEIRPYEEHNPLRLFPKILEDAQKTLSLSPDEANLPCPELDMDLPNPFHFLKHGYPARQGYARLWYKSITHGDLNMQNILLDEGKNIYIIDFSETGMRNVVSDFARLEAIVKIEMTTLESNDDLKRLIEFEKTLAKVSALNEMPRFIYHGKDVMVKKAHRMICLLRTYADRVTIYETDILPYLLALLQWTYPVVSYGGASSLQKRFAAYSAGLMVQRILDLEQA